MGTYCLIALGITSRFRCSVLLRVPEDSRTDITTRSILSSNQNITQGARSEAYIQQ